MINNILENHNIFNLKIKPNKIKFLSIKDVNIRNIPIQIMKNIQKTNAEKRFKIINNKVFSSNKNNIFRNNSTMTKTININDNKLYSKKDLFKGFWFKCHNPESNKIFKYKKKLIDKILSVETLSKVYYDVEILKILNYSQEDLKYIEDIHNNLFCDSENFQVLRNHLIKNNYNSDSTIFSIISSMSDKDAKNKQILLKINL